jgi:hypothetical protein
MIKKLDIAFRATALVALYCTSAVAQDVPLQQYEVELVIFKFANPTGTPEDWALEEARALAALPTVVAESEEPPAPDTANPAAPIATPAPATSVAPATGEGSESSFQPIAAAQFRMAAIEASLRRNRNYQVLAHVAWLQPGFAMNNPLPFSLDGLVPPDAGIAGNVTLVRGRYLHVTMDLTHQSSDGKRFILREQRRLRRSGEKHYFDHPYFGVVALVTPRAQ